ncbi:MAG: hypothetical protein AAF389_04975 [Gemmatimonadota bacterium]
MPSRISNTRLFGASAAIASTLFLATGVEAQSPPEAEQIAQAVQPAPPMLRGGAMVYGFDDGGAFVTLREGTNDLICLADDPNRDGFNVACYHDSLEPFMARGRELRAEGVTDSGELAQRRWDEADAGTLSMPETPATLYVMTGDGFDAAAGEVMNSFLRWVVYTPWATPETTGLPPMPVAPGAPWLMFPGTAGAHIMITPPAGGN